MPAVLQSPLRGRSAAGERDVHGGVCLTRDDAAHEQGAWRFLVSEAPVCSPRCYEAMPPARQGALERPHAVIVSYEGSDACVSVPETLGGYPVLEVADEAFERCASLVDVSLPDCVLGLGAKAFSRCEGLESVRFSDSLTYLFCDCLFSCRRVAHVHLPRSLRAFDKRLISTSRIAKLALPRDLETFIWGNENTSSVLEVEVDAENVHFSTDGLALFTYDGSELVQMVVGARSYRIPDSCRVIQRYAFRNSYQLQEIDFGNGVEIIEPYAFSHTRLHDVYVPPCVRHIGSRAFYMCRSLVNVCFSEGLVSIGEAAFARTALSSAHLPASLRSFARGVFLPSSRCDARQFALTVDAANPYLYSDGRVLYRCEEDGIHLQMSLMPMRRYVVERGCVGIDAHAFEHNTNLAEIELSEGLLEIGDNAFAGCVGLSRVVLPDSLVRIGSQAFFESALERLHIGSGLAHVGSCAFSKVDMQPGFETRGLLDVSVSPRNARYYLDSHLLVERGERGGRAICFVGSCEKLRVPDDVVSISEMCFFHAPLAELVLHDHLLAAPAGAFSSMCSLRRVHVEQPGSRGTLVFEFPKGYRSAEGVERSLGLDDAGHVFRFEAYDKWMLEYFSAPERDAAEFARMALSRLATPVCLANETAGRFADMLRSLSGTLCKELVEQRDFASLERLQQQGFLSGDELDETLEELTQSKDAQAKAYLMELKRRQFGFAGRDLSL